MPTPEKIVSQWIEEYFEFYPNSRPHLTAHGFISADINECGGLQEWFLLPNNAIVDSFAETLDSVSENLIEDYEFVVEQEDLLETLKIDQNVKSDPVELVKMFKLGVIDIFKALSIYMEVRELAMGHWEQESN